MGAYDQKLEDVLELSDLPADTQMKLFDQQAQRWHTYQEKQNQPLPVTMNVVPQDQQDLKDGAQVGVPKSSKDGVEEDILESVPKSMRVKARWLLQRMKRSDVLNWNDKGELLIDGTAVPGTHLVDLIKDMVHKRKRVPNATSWQEFATGLRQLHIAQEVVGNPDPWDYITNPRENLASYLPETSFSLSTSSASRKTR